MDSSEEKEMLKLWENLFCMKKGTAEGQGGYKKRMGEEGKNQKRIKGKKE